MPSPVTLKVAEAPQSDVGLGRARVDAETRLALDVKNGEIVEVVGKRTTAAKVSQAATEDEGKGIVRVDGLTRRNLDVILGDNVEMRKAKALAAERVVLAPIISGGHRISFGQGTEDFVKRGLLKRPVTKGDVVIVPGIALMGGALPFAVVNAKPEGIVQVVDDTVIEMLEEPVREPFATGTPAEQYKLFASELARGIRRVLGAHGGWVLKTPGDEGEKARRLAEAARKLADEADPEEK